MVLTLAQNVAHANRFHQQGFSVLLIDYRGYGRSQGSPTESRVYQDAATAWDYLVKRHQPSEILSMGILWGVL